MFMLKKLLEAVADKYFIVPSFVLLCHVIFLQFLENNIEFSTCLAL